MDFLGPLETEDIINQVELKKGLIEKAQQEEKFYFSKRANLLKDLIEILTCEIIARSVLFRTQDTIKSLKYDFSREKVILSRKVVLKAENSTFSNSHQKVK